MRSLLCLVLVLALPTAARAEISRALPPSDRAVVDATRRHVEFAQTRYLVVNGQVMRAEVGQTDLSPSALMDRIEAEWTYRYAHVMSGQLDEPTVASVERELRRPVRYDAPSWSMFGQFFGGAPDRERPFLEAFVTSGALGPGAQGGAITAAFGGDGHTDVWLMHLDEDFRPAGYIGAGEGDVGPADVPGIERWPGSRRGLTVSEYTDISETHSLTYVGKGSIEAHAAHYEAQLRKLGMMQAPTTRRPGEILLRFADRKRDVAVFVREGGPEDGDVIDIIQISSSERSIP